MAKAGLQFNKKDEWYTPKEVVDFFAPFEYDPCTTKERAEYFGIPNYDTIETDGLETDWADYKKIWCNPPFTRKFEFLLKATQSLEEMDGDAEICFLLPIDSLTTRIFNDIISGTNYELIIPNGRIKFEDATGRGSSPAFGSVILKLGYMNSCVRHWRLYGRAN
jgi:phage N-6-adenine-methyltransferase